MGKEMTNEKLIQQIATMENTIAELTERIAQGELTEVIPSNTSLSDQSGTMIANAGGVANLQEDLDTMVKMLDKRKSQLNEQKK
jgi:hypothetical protein